MFNIMDIKLISMPIIIEFILLFLIKSFFCFIFKIISIFPRFFIEFIFIEMILNTKYFINQGGFIFMNNESQVLYSVSELAEYLMVGKNAAYELLKNNKIKSFRIGKIHKIPLWAINEYIKNECEKIQPSNFTR